MQRHPHLEQITKDIAAVLLGQAASNTSGGTDLYVLPIWAWGPSRTDVGRKDRAADGSQLAMPIRITWDHPPIGHVTDLDTGRANYKLMSAGYETSGSIDVTEAPMTTAGPDGIILPAPELEDLSAYRITPPVDTDVLEQTITNGQLARWNLMALIEKSVQLALPGKISALTISVMGPEWRADAAGFFDAVDESEVISRFCIGTPTPTTHRGRSARPPAVRLIDRLLSPDAFKRADPQRVMFRSVRRDVAEELRRYVGDPREGEAIRATARQLGVKTYRAHLESLDEADVQRVLTAHQTANPRKSIGRQRVVDALTVQPPGRALTMDPAGDHPADDPHWRGRSEFDRGSR